MTKTFKFYTENNNNNSFFPGNKSTNYSKILDDIILTDVIKKNSYLFDTDPIVLTSSPLKDSDELTKAANFLANYKKNKKTYNLPYILGKLYKLSNGTPVVFYDDEIQIGFDTYKYSDFTNFSLLNNLTTDTKKIIINIYTTGASNININLL